MNNFLKAAIITISLFIGFFLFGIFLIFIIKVEESAPIWITAILGFGSIFGIIVISIWEGLEKQKNIHLSKHKRSGGKKNG